MFSPAAKIRSSLGVLLFTAFLAVNFFGLAHFSMSSTMDMGLDPATCPFMIGPAICTMSPLQHIDEWQQMFASIPTKFKLLLFVLLTSAFLFFLALWNQRIFAPPRTSAHHRIQTQERALRLPPPLFVQLFSQGILNPKSF